MATPRGRTSGMSLGRLLVLLVGAVVAVFVAVRTYAQRQELHRREITIQRILAIREALEKYAMDNAGRFPPSEPGLTLLIEPPKGELATRVLRWKGPYLPSRQYLLDGWGQPFRYCRGGRGDPPKPYELWSYGRDGHSGGHGLDADIDIWNPDSLVP